IVLEALQRYRAEAEASQYENLTAQRPSAGPRSRGARSLARSVSTTASVLALQQLDNSAFAFHGIIYRHLDDWVTFLECQSCRLGLFIRPVGFLGLSIHLES